MGDNPASVDFGFRTVSRDAKRGMVARVFTSVASRYDLMNDLMSLGIHRRWKKRLISRLAPRPGAKLLDLAGGTGDISFGWLEAGGGSVVLADINPAMLGVAEKRAVERASIGGLSLVVADAERLPLPDRSFHTATIAFGLRNCTDKPAVLREAWRVLRPGGRFFCLEFSRLEIAALIPFYDAWSFEVLPWLGAIVARDRASYRYLAESIRTFPDAATLADMLGKAGFARVEVERLSGGIAAIHSGWRL